MELLVHCLERAVPVVALDVLHASLLGIGVLLDGGNPAGDVARTGRHELQVVDALGAKLRGNCLRGCGVHVDGARDGGADCSRPPCGANVSNGAVGALDHGEAVHAVCVNARREGRGNPLRTRCHALAEALLAHVVLGDVLVVVGGMRASSSAGSRVLADLLGLLGCAEPAKALPVLGTHVPRRMSGAGGGSRLRPICGERLVCRLCLTLGGSGALASDRAKERVGAHRDEDPTRKAHAEGTRSFGIDAREVHACKIYL